ELDTGKAEGKRRGCGRIPLVLLCCCVLAQPQDLPLSHLDAAPHDPLYTSYAAPLERSEYFVDQAFYLDAHSPEKGVTYSNAASGSFALAWRMGSIGVTAWREYFKPPIIHRSYSDFVELEYWPFTTVEVRERFNVYSSRFAILDLEIRSHDSRSQKLTACIHYDRGELVEVRRDGGSTVLFSHRIDPKTWSESPHPQFDPDQRDILMASLPAESVSGYAEPADALRAIAANQLTGSLQGGIRAFVVAVPAVIAPGATVSLRIVRGMQPAREAAAELASSARKLLAEPLAPVIAAGERAYARIPRACTLSRRGWCVRFPSSDWELAYWSAFSEVRAQMMPREGESHFNYYVFSREPMWSWGHDGQVFHESIVMQAYALMDPRGAQDSQRVFMERQRHDPNPELDGYIGYRVGPYVNRTFPVAGQDTSSAPFFSWTNWEIYAISRDRAFLADAYRSGAALATWFLRTHDPDHDGMLVWGGNAMLENVRDSVDVIWSLFGGGDESPKQVKALDLMCMMVKETRALARMAGELGHTAEQRQWAGKADQMASAVRNRMWDPDTGFFYNLARDTGTFTTKSGLSLKRKEIIGFLPLWAGIATPQQAERLRAHVADPASFARRFGMPTLAADDPYYDAEITRCCQWNGAVWLLWDYMVERGLLDYGFRPEAEQLVRRAMEGVLFQLRANHRLWESYSPDYTQLNSPGNYIWDSIIARMIFDLYGSK
ncbi:MAG: hypothetical protein JO041_04400, partial [Acidobacteria bacterium]|nr:hypothetical protein [Acidobacteriota bacterium]